MTWGVDAAVADARVSESESMKSRLKAGISRIRNMYGLVGEMDMANGWCALYATTSFSRTCHMSHGIQVPGRMGP